jgi:hypothetical protein
MYPFWLSLNAQPVLSFYSKRGTSTPCTHFSHRRITVSAWFTISIICVLSTCIDLYLHKAELSITYLLIVFLPQTHVLVNKIPECLPFCLLVRMHILLCHLVPHAEPYFFCILRRWLRNHAVGMERMNYAVIQTSNVHGAYKAINCKFGGDSL